MNNNKGVALIMVVSILAVAGIMAVSFAFTMRLELKSSTNYLEATRASYLAEAGVSYAEAVLKSDDTAIDSFEDSWYTVFHGEDVDNDGDGANDSKWIEVYNEAGSLVGRYAVLVRDTASLLNINIATKQNLSPLKITEGWTPHELDLKEFLGSLEIEDVEKMYAGIMDFRYGLDGEPGEIGIDDNNNQRVLGSDGIDNNADGIIDESGEGIDEVMEFDPQSPYADDNAFETPFELAKLESVSEEDFNKIYPYITSYSADNNVNLDGQLRENVNSMNAASLAVILQDAGGNDPFQKAVNIIDACDEDFSQSIATKLYKKYYAVNKGPIGDWTWKDSHYESDLEDGQPLVITWTGMSEGEYYIGMFGKAGERVGEVTVNGMEQSLVEDGDILRVGAISFEEGILELVIRNKEKESVCYFSHLELYPRLGQEGFESVEVRGVEGIRINEIMVKPSISMEALGGQDPGGDWIWQGGYYQNDEPNGSKAGEGTWIWNDVPDGIYYVKLRSGITGEVVGDVEIDGARSYEMVDGEIFKGGDTVSVTNGKLTLRIQNNFSSGSAYFKGIELRQEPDGEYIELVNLTPNEVNLGGWSVDASGESGWPASIPLGTVIGPDEHLALCVDKDDSQDGVDGNDLSFVSIWGQQKSAELHFVRAVTPDSDLISNEPYPTGNFITLKDSMGHIVDQVEYLTSNVSENISLELADPSYVKDSNINGIPDNWYQSTSGTPGLPNDNDGMKEEGEEGEVEHSISEVTVKNKNLSSIGEIAFVSLSSEEWKKVSLDDVAKISDRLSVFGLRLEAEEHIVPGYEGGWNLAQRASPLTDQFESGSIDSIGMWRWGKKDGLKDGYYTLRIVGEEEEEISVSLSLADGSWSAFTPPLTPGPDKGILFGNIEIGTDSSMSTPSGILELKVKNVSKTGGAHFDFIRLDPINSMDGKININTASEKVLSVLPGVDATIAAKIIDNREFGDKNGLRLGIGDLLSGDTLGGSDSEKRDAFKKISNLVTVRASIYRIIATAQVLKDGKVLSEKKIWAVFER